MAVVISRVECGESWALSGTHRSAEKCAAYYVARSGEERPQNSNIVTCQHERQHTWSHSASWLSRFWDGRAPFRAESVDLCGDGWSWWGCSLQGGDCEQLLWELVGGRYVPDGTMFGERDTPEVTLDVWSEAWGRERGAPDSQRTVVPLKEGENGASVASGRHWWILWIWWNSWIFVVQQILVLSSIWPTDSHIRHFICAILFWSAKYYSFDLYMTASAY